MGFDDPAELAWRVEEACANAWPSPRQAVQGDWLIRISGGATRRTNSVNPLRAARHEPAAVLEAAQALYRAQDQDTLFRVPSFVHGVDGPLEQMGFSFEGETCTLFADLGERVPAWDHGVELTTRPTGDWLRAKARLTPLKDNEHWIYEAMLGAIVAPRAFAGARVEGELVAVAYGVVNDGLLVVESVVTDERFRQRGLARRTVGKLIDWACGQAAHGAALQVVADNHAAHSLYRSLGFDRELYRYHYRREPIRRPVARGGEVRTAQAAPRA
jgi:ribosomal protein S18 acetylase RimI-like enzyme